MKQFNGYKYCSTCESIYPIIFFHKNKGNPDGLSSLCKECKIESTMKWKKLNPEKVKKNYKKWYKGEKYKYHNDIVYKNKLLIRIYKYRKTENGKSKKRQQQTKRDRNLGYNELLSNPFECRIEWHHIDNVNVVAIPYDIHRMYYHPDTVIHRENLQSIVEQIYGDIV